MHEPRDPPLKVVMVCGFFFTPFFLYFSFLSSSKAWYYPNQKSRKKKGIEKREEEKKRRREGLKVRIKYVHSRDSKCRKNEGVLNFPFREKVVVFPLSRREVVRKWAGHMCMHACIHMQKPSHLNSLLSRVKKRKRYFSTLAHSLCLERRGRERRKEMAETISQLIPPPKNSPNIGVVRLYFFLEMILPQVHLR